MIKLGIIYGGISTEHDVSIMSAKSILENLNKESLVFYGPIRMTVKKDVKRTRNILPLYRK